MALAQNKRRQRAELVALGLPVPPFQDVDAVEDLIEFGQRQGWPVVAKASRGGYDGRGVWTLAGPEAARRFWAETRDAAVELLAEAWLSLDAELAVLVARRPSGQTAVYPAVETVQRGGICHELRVPAAVAPELLAEAQRQAVTIAEAIDAVGILAVEFFVAGGRLFVNELAPRPHNSGHWTIEGATTSQFEQHLRAVLDWPLGATDLTGNAVATVNLLGAADGSDPRSRAAAALSITGVHLHLYGKAARPGRKLGHVTVVADGIKAALAAARTAAARLTGDT
jgi:5-(carboxyamino)imidazole ribonucleotide synthase